MNNNSENKDILYDIIGGFEDELIEKAADYKKSSKILAFPMYKYVNMVAAFLICIISTVVFVKLKPVVEINESLIIPTNQPKVTATVKPTEEIKETLEPVTEIIATDTPVESIIPTIFPMASLRPAYTDEPLIMVVPTRIPDFEVSPTRKPGYEAVTTARPFPTIKPVIINPVRTPIPTASVITTKPPVKTTEPTAEPTVATNVPVTTTKPPVKTAEPTDVPPVITATPVVTTKPPVETVEPTNVPPVITATPEVTTRPPVETVEPTNVPPIATVTPVVTTKPPVITTEPTKVPTVETVTPGTPCPTDTPAPGTSCPTETPTPEPTAPPLDMEDCTTVEGTPVTVIELNGAVYDTEHEIIEFTDESEKNKLGVEIVNPIAGNTNMTSDYGYLMNVDTNGLLNAFHLYGSYLGWGTDGEKLPVPEGQVYNGMEFNAMDLRIKSLFYTDINTVYYPKPENKTGFSVSFWANTSNEKESAPAVTFINERQCIVVSINGNVDYADIDDSKNYFSADSDDYCNPGMWHYYTITYANDWITYYVDGIEVPYCNVQLITQYIKSFNDGFLTRYNPAVTWSEEDYQNDWRGYLRKQREDNEFNQSIITGMRYTVMNVSRYQGRNNSKKILLNFMSSPDTRVVLGGGKLDYDHSIATYYRNSGTKFAQVRYYNVELSDKNVYANYHEALKSKPD